MFLFCRRLFSTSELLPRQELFHLNILNIRQLQQIHARILTNSSLQSDSSVIHFLSSCVRSSKLDYASQFLYNFSTLNLDSWNTILRFSAESFGEDIIIHFYKNMLFGNVMPDRTTFTLLVRQCASLALVRMGLSIHCQIVKIGFECDRFLKTGLLDFYGKAGYLEFSRRVFREMSVTDIIANNAMIAVLSKHGCAKDAMDLFDAMPQKSSASWNTMITCYCKMGDVEFARSIFDKNPIKDIVSWNAMIDGYCKVEQHEPALELFNQMGSAKNSVTWNAMITGCVQCRDFLRAISMFQQMQVENVRPTEVTMVGLLSACAHLGALDMGIWVHNYIRHHHLKFDVVLGNALIDMYCKCGDVESGLQIFHGLPRRNIYCWNSIIIGLGMHGYGGEAIGAFQAMQQQRINPDGITFVGLLCGCGHSGLVSDGWHYFSLMSTIYCIEPGIEHYGCMVDLLGRAGFLEEALQFIKSMPMRPNAVVLGSLLRACKFHKDTKVSEHVMQLLLELDPSDGGNYVFLSNVYASAKRWDDVEMLRKFMIEKGVRKMPGCSSIEVNNRVHEFVASDTSHPCTVQINDFLEETSKRLIDMGYQPDTVDVLHDIEGEEKEDAVRYHSEKLAIAFGLMSIREGKPIRIVKNLRVCNDCHSFIKLMTKLFNREIIVRDRNRFHHFRVGTCSCREYW